MDNYKLLLKIMTRLLFLTCSLALLAGCEQTTIVGATGEGGMLQYLSSMDSVRVTFTVFSRHTNYEKPGETIVSEGRRTYWFTNYDSATTLQWSDSGFSAKAKFGFRLFMPDYTNEYYFPNVSSSVIAGFYDEATRTVRDMRCVLKFYEQMGGADYRRANASLAINEMRRGAVNDDSVEFYATGSELRNIISVGFGAEENYSSSAYEKHVTLDSILWESHEVDPELRVIFYRKKVE